jgi:hypothetical protein
MSTEESGSWPDDIKPKIQTPLAILQGRAVELTAKTKGILIGKVMTSHDADNARVYHSLDAEVPALRNFRQRLVTIRHDREVVYPAYVETSVQERIPDDQMGLYAMLGRMREKPKNLATTDDELISIMKKALHSDQVKSTLASLIALANQAMEENGSEASQSTPETRSGVDLEPEEREDDSDEVAGT